jgi:hypothetical protein
MSIIPLRKGDKVIFAVGGAENIGQFLHGFYG